jgi:type VI protein secretion system component VasF
MLRRAWNDSVWSKVIAAGITAALAAIGAVVVKNAERVFDVSGAAAAMLTRSVAVPVWLVVGVLAILAALMVLVIFLWRRKRPFAQGDEVQPNAVPVLLVPPRR